MASEQTTIVNEADLSVTKTQTSPAGNVPAGTNVTYLITVTNNGPSDATAATISDTLPAGLTIVSVTPDAALDCSGSDGADGTQISCILASTLVDQAMGSVTVVAAVSASQPAGQVTNDATVSGVVPSDPTNGNDTGSAMTNVVVVTDLVITKTQSSPAAGTPVIAGQPVTYTVAVANNGPSNAGNVTVSDSLPAALTNPTTVGCAEDPGGVPTCSLGAIAGNGSSKSFLLTAIVNPNQSSGMVTNNVSASSNGIDPTPASASETITVIAITFFLLIDEDSISSGSQPNFFPDSKINEDIADLGLRDPLPFFVANVGNTKTLFTGEVGDEGWFAPKTIPESWNGAGPTADGLRNYLAAGPGLGTGDDPEALLDKVAEVTPLRATGLNRSSRGKTTVSH